MIGNEKEFLQFILNTFFISETQIIHEKIYKHDENKTSNRRYHTLSTFIKILLIS